MTVIIFNVIVDSELRLLNDEAWIYTHGNKINNKNQNKITRSNPGGNRCFRRRGRSRP